MTCSNIVLEAGTDVFSQSKVLLAKSEAYALTAERGESKYLAIALLSGTGMRLGEITALEWRDLHDHTISISRMVVASKENGHQNGWVEKQHPKTDAGVRTIPLNDECIEALSFIKALNEERGYPAGSHDKIFWRVYHGKQEPATPRTIDNSIRDICKRVGICEKSAHDMRRTVFTRLSMIGMPLVEIQAIADHNEISQTLKYIRRPDGDIETASYLSQL